MLRREEIGKTLSRERYDHIRISDLFKERTGTGISNGTLTKCVKEKIGGVEDGEMVVRLT